MLTNTDVTIIGSGLTGLTLAYYLQKKGMNVVLLEKDSRIGGVIDTVEEKDFTFEIGPNTGVLSSRELVNLFKDLEGKCTLEIANPASKKRLIWKGDRWHALPSGIPGGIKTPLFTLHDKVRILGEPFRKKGTNPDETVAELVKRRMGMSFLNYAVDPFISGIYAGDPDRLVTRFALPKLYQLEQSYGSFVRGGIKKHSEPKTEQDKEVTREVFSVKGGLKNLINALGVSINATSIKLNCSDLKVLPNKDGFDVSYTAGDGEVVKMKSVKVVSTIGAYALPDLLPTLRENDLAPITKLKYAKVVQVIAGFKDWQGITLDAFGGLVPTVENRKVLGILFPSSIFKGRTPKNGALLSIFMGGLKAPDVISKSDEEVLELALVEIREMMGTNAKPELLKIYRYPKAIAQYEKSSNERLEAIATIEKQLPGLFLAGNIRDGIGMADRVKQAVHLASNISV